MLAEVYNPITPASRHRALIAAAGLLLLASALAAEMTWRRSGAPLSVRIHPPGWKISFEPPKGWVRGLSGDSTAVITFRSSNRAGNTSTLAFWRLDRWIEDDPEAIGALNLGQDGTLVGYEPNVTEPRSPTTKLGPVDAYERVDAQQRTVVRASVHWGGEVYAVSLSVEGGAIDEQVYGLFDLACRSIRFEDP